MNPFSSPKRPQTDNPAAEKLYGAIVAQARLPVFYRDLAVPDTLEGRFLVLSLTLFGVMHRLKQEREVAVGLAQELADRFAADMEIVLRESGVGDLSIPKRMRALATSSAALLQGYEDALVQGDRAIAGVIAEAFPFEPKRIEAAVSERLAHYLKVMVGALETQSFSRLSRGLIVFPRPPVGEAPRGD